MEDEKYLELVEAIKAITKTMGSIKNALEINAKALENINANVRHNSDAIHDWAERTELITDMAYANRDRIEKISAIINYTDRAQNGLVN